MKQLYIHIGAHKTASTFLQWECFPNLRDVDYGFSSQRLDEDFGLGLKTHGYY